MSDDATRTHTPCCSSHGLAMTCEEYRRTHFVEVRPCCVDDAAILTGPLTHSEWRTFQNIPEQGYSHRGWVDSKIEQRVDATIRERLVALVGLIEEHARIEKHNDTVPLNHLSDLQPEPRAEQYRAALLGDTRG